MSLSVLMTVYNEEGHIDRAIQSILDATYKDFEFIIVNDGSTDASLAIIKSWAKKDSRITIIDQDNTGIVGALNSGLDACSGTFIARMDADDASPPQRFEEQIKILQDDPDVVLVGGWYEEITDDTSATKPIFTSNDDLQRTLYVGNSFVHGSVMLRAKALKDIGGYKELCPAEDYDLWIRLSQIGELRATSEVIYTYTVNAVGITATKRPEQLQITKQLLSGLWKTNPPAVWDKNTLRRHYKDNLNVSEALAQKTLSDNLSIGIQMLKHTHLLHGVKQISAVYRCNGAGRNMVIQSVKHKVLPS